MMSSDMRRGALTSIFAIVLLGGCASPTPSQTPTQSATAPPSPVARSTNLGLPVSGGLHIFGVENPGCASEGGCAAFFRIQPTPGISTPLAREWRFEGVPADLHAPPDAPTTLLPGIYRVSALLNTVSDVISPGFSPAIQGIVSSCDAPLTVEPSTVGVVVRVTFHGSGPDPCAIEIVTDPAQGPTAPPPTTSPAAAETPWKVLVASDNAGAEWSPDGRWLLVWDQVTNGTPADRHVSLDDAQGNVIRAFDGENPVWLDAHSFVITRDGKSYLGIVDAATLTPISPTLTDHVYSNGRGALAYETRNAFGAAARFVVWRPAGASAPHPGVPVAWSRDGTKLAVWHWTSGTGPESSGWLEVLSWPGLRQLAAIHDHPSGPFLHGTLFDPSGRYVAFLCGKVCVLDLATRQTTVAVPTVPSDLIAWNEAGQLVIPSIADGSVSIYDVRGVRQGIVNDVGDSVSGSADGTTVAAWFNSDQRPIVLLGPSGQRSIALPGPVQADPQLSPDGSGLVVVCAANGVYEALLLTP
jgi:hypothetical protein